MKKVDMINHLKSKIDEASQNAIDWNIMLSDELEKIGTTFNEALEDKSIYSLIEFRAWQYYNDEKYTLKSLLKDFEKNKGWFNNDF
jgi:hypothetical protein